MSEQVAYAPEHIQKTPEERQAQAMRIANKLLERAMKLPVDSEGKSTASGQSIEATHDDLQYGKKLQVTTQKPNGGFTQLMISSPHNSNVYTEKLIVEDRRDNEFRRLQTSLDDISGRGKYDRVSGEAVSTQKLSIDEAESATAKALMEARGAIAAQEIAGNKGDIVDSMF